jgi:hypothetical protein
MYSNIATMCYKTDISAAKVDEETVEILRNMTLEDILEGRSKETSYLFFCKHFIRCVVGKVKFRDKSMHTKLSNYCTPTDEAFALICAINSWNVWKNMYFNDGADRGNVKTTYTTGRGSKALKFGGWRVDGLVKFNELVEWVNNDRNNNNGRMEKILLEEIIKDIDGKQSGKQRKTPTFLLPKTTNTLSMINVRSDNDKTKELGSTIADSNSVSTMSQSGNSVMNINNHNKYGPNNKAYNAVGQSHNEKEDNKGKQKQRKICDKNRYVNSQKYQHNHHNEYTEDSSSNDSESDEDSYENNGKHRFGSYNNKNSSDANNHKLIKNGKNMSSHSQRSISSNNSKSNSINNNKHKYGTTASTEQTARKQNGTVISGGSNNSGNGTNIYHRKNDR